MKGCSFVLMILLLTTLTTTSRSSSGHTSAPMPYLYVDSYSGYEGGWATSGASPWIDDSESFITGSTANSNESWFGFADWTENSSPPQVFLEIQHENLAGCPLTLYLNNTESVAHLGPCYIQAKGWQSLNVTAYLKNTAEINGATVKFTCLNDTIACVTVYRVRLHLFFPIPETYGFSTNIANSPCTLYCEWHSPVGLSTYKIEHNNTGAITTLTGTLSGFDAWSNASVILNATSTNSVWVRFSANDTANNWSETLNQTVRLVWSGYQANGANYVGVSSNAGTRHGLGRDSFYAVETELFFVCYYNTTDYVASYSSDGYTWFGNQSIKTCSGGAGYFYTYYENRGGRDYFMYEYCDEAVGSPLVYRKAEILTNGTLNWLTTEQTVIAGSSDYHVCVNGIAIDDFNQTYICYGYGNATSWIGCNVTKTTRTDGVWVTADGYPKTVTYDTLTYPHILEYYIFSMNNNSQVYVAISGGPDYSAKGRILQNDMFSSLENISNCNISEYRRWSAAAYQGNIYYTFTDTTGTIRFCFRNFTSGTWATRDYVIAQATGNARVVAQVAATDSLLYVNWWKDNADLMVRIYNITSTSWTSVERIWLCPSDYTVATENDMMMVGPRTAILHATLSKISTDNREQWAYAYSWVRYLRPDINKDGTVDMADISILVDYFMTNPESPNWNPDADANKDNSVDMGDISIAIEEFMT